MLKMSSKLLPCKVRRCCVRDTLPKVTFRDRRDSTSRRKRYKAAITS
jgi:hypothetical protein